MGTYKVNNYFNEQYGSLMNETRECRAFNLGYARGLFELYKYLAKTDCIEFADKIFKSIEKSDENFAKYVELYKKEDSRAEKYLDEIREHKQSKS